MQRLEDAKNNIVDVTIFESNLSQFILEHPEFYQNIFIKLLDAIECFIHLNRNDRITERYLSQMFWKLNKKFSNADSFAKLKNNFNLVAIKDCLKKCSDDVLEFEFRDDLPKTNDTSSLFALSYQTLYSNPKRGAIKLNRYLRSDKLFRGANRGVKRVEPEPEEIQASHNLGIVEEQFTPEHLRNYFEVPNDCAGFEYVPDYTGYAANWLYQRNLPVISGVSGSIEQFFTRLLPLVSLTREEIKLALLAQTACMIAMGHHSFFECMLVADRFGYKFQETNSLLEFYLQCIPGTILEHQDFTQFMQSDKGACLLADLPLYRNVGKVRAPRVTQQFMGGHEDCWVTRCALTQPTKN